MSWSGSSLTPTRILTCSCAALEWAKARVTMATLTHATMVLTSGVSGAASRRVRGVNGRHPWGSFMRSVLSKNSIETFRRADSALEVRRTGPLGGLRAL